MRRHAFFVQLAPRLDAERFHRVVSPETLVAARLDCGYSALIDNHGLLDLTFVRAGEVVCVPFLIVQGSYLFVREASPFVWPTWLPPMRRELALSIEDALEPWARSLSIARFVHGEHVKLYGSDERAHALFHEARASGFMGAARTDDVLRSAAPYVYALRFAKDAKIAIHDSNGAHGAAILARAGSVRADVGDPVRAANAAAWFGIDVYDGYEPSEAFDLAIGTREVLPNAKVRIALDGARDGERLVSVATPIPIKLMTSFDVNDGAEAGRLGVSAPQVLLRSNALPPMRVVGGSSGRIAIVVRDDYAATDDADSDAARALVQRLSEQGFAASLVRASETAPSSFDLIHVVGTDCAQAFEGAIARKGGALPPIVISPYADDPKNEAAWGTFVQGEAIFNSLDEAKRGLYEWAVAKRQLIADRAPPIGTSRAADPQIRNLFARARAAVVSGTDEERQMRDAFGFTAAVTRVVPALLGDEPEPSPAIVGLVGERDFVLVHAPIDPRCNQFLIAQACAKLRYPLVLVGPIVHAPYYSEVLARLGPEGMWLPPSALGPAELAGLYRRAKVFADVSWSARGLYRVARAAAAGAAVVASASGYARTIWPGLVEVVDPGSLESISGGLQAAWSRAGETGPALSQRTVGQYAPFPMLVALLAAYQGVAAPA